MNPAFCLVLDILGFRAAVIRSEAEYQSAAVDAWVYLVDSAAGTRGIERYQLISDSLFVIESPDDAGLARLVDLARDILTTGLRQGHLVRGAIARGDVRWDPRIAHGAAIVSAYEFGQSCNWAGIACTYAFAELRDLWGADSVVLYAVPRKTLSATNQPALAWSIPSDNELLQAAGVVPESRSEPNEAVLSKLRAIAQFRDYLAWLRKADQADPRRYHARL